MAKRLVALDYLRGLAAVGIMIYHYSMWSLGSIYQSDTFLGRIGIYGVSIFYILSGLTLYHVYGAVETNKERIGRFFLKRFFRIYPLLWLATLGTLIVFSTPLNWHKLLLNVTGLFGFIQWDGYIATGAWSIGNELVFYAFFPIFVHFSQKSKVAFYGISALIVGIGFYFAFFHLDPALSFDEQWKDYVNPLNQLYLFLSGFWIGWLFSNSNFEAIWLRIALVFLLAAFFYIPVNGPQLNLVVGAERIILSAVCIAICLVFYKGKLEIPGWVGRFFSILGEISYSIYLLHPIVFWILANNLNLLGMDRLWYALPATLVVSFISYFLFEKSFMRLGNFLIGKKATSI